MNQISFLFDIDGVLTQPITESRKISVIDPNLINYLNEIHQKGFKFSFITGRAYPWINKFLLFDFSSFLKEIPIYMEYGLTSYFNDKLTISSEAVIFRNAFSTKIISAIQKKCQQDNVFFDSLPYIDYPDHGSLWLEEKNGMISIVSNRKISAEEVQNIVVDSTKGFTNNFRIVKHHLGCDILPKGWSKEIAAEKSYNLLDPDKNIQKWFVFGDNESDREMCNPLPNVEFIDTKDGASETTLRNLKDILK